MFHLVLKPDNSLPIYGSTYFRLNKVCVGYVYAWKWLSIGYTLGPLARVQCFNGRDLISYLARSRARNPKASFSSICLRRPSVLHLFHMQRSSIPSKFLYSKRKVYSLFLARHRINSYYFLENRRAFRASISILVVLLRSRDIVITVLLSLCYLYFVF